MRLPSLEKELARSGGPSIIAVVDLLLAEACRRGASDLHLVPQRDGLRVRLRVDGVLFDAFSFSLAVRTEIIARVKVLAGLRTDEHFSAQDGRARHSLPDGSAVDIRVSVAPTHHGENAVLRLLEASKTPHTLASLGFLAGDCAKSAAMMAKSSGMAVVTGPTGSGKTTTLHALLLMRNAHDASVVTLEDPVEYEIAGVTQMQVRERGGLSFAAGLRAILRQDPDVIMVGEIRDEETANVAVHAALTGHLLLSTLHAATAASALPRLLDMKVEPFLLASTLSLVIAQRLARRLCGECAEDCTVTEAMRRSSGLTGLVAGERLRRRRGCSACGDSGYAGRLCVSEVMVVDDALREALLRRAPLSELTRLAVSGGMTTLAEDGLAKARAGLTTIEEIARVTL